MGRFELTMSMGGQTTAWMNAGSVAAILAALSSAQWDGVS